MSSIFDKANNLVEEATYERYKAEPSAFWYIIAKAGVLALLAIAEAIGSRQ